MSYAVVNPFKFELLVWHWPIAVYLFLVGISSGMVIVSLILKRWILSKGDDPVKENPVIQAMAIIAPLTVIAGLFILIFDLSKPWMFWKIMIFYNPRSVMSLGVLLFQIYMLFLFSWLLILYQEEVKRLLSRVSSQRNLLAGLLTLFNTVISYLQRIHNFIEIGLLICALLLGAYTGFLLSALKSYPLLNSPVLPVLFLVSGIASGAAMCIVASLLWFKETTHSRNMAFIHQIELPIVMMEIFLLVAFFIGAYFGGGQKVVAVVNAIGHGFWAQIFWFGIVGVGILIPLMLNLFSPDHLKHNRPYMIFVSSCTLAGIFMLRHFILYAGQMTLV